MSKRTNGEGTIYQRKNGLWCAELTMGYDANKKRIKKSFSSMSLETLQKKLNDEKFKLDRNMVTKKSEYTLTEWFLPWLDNYKASELKPSTYDRYEYAYNTLARDEIGSTKMVKVRPEIIQHVYNQMYKRGLSTSSIKQLHIALNQAFNQAIKNSYIFQNPCSAVTVPKTKKRVTRAMTAEEQKAFMENCPDNTYGNMFIFDLNTGMRCGEMAALIWKDVDLENKTVSVSRTTSRIKNRSAEAKTSTKIVISMPKTQKGIREIPLNKTAEKILGGQKGKHDVWVFSSRNGTVLTSQNIRKAFLDILEKAGIPKDITIHSLRHTFATRLLEKGANIKAVSEILGHKSIQITLDIYSHVFPNLKRDTINLLD